MNDYLNQLPKSTYLWVSTFSFTSWQVYSCQDKMIYHNQDKGKLKLNEYIKWCLVV